MKQVLQDLKTGAVTVHTVPDPAPAPDRLLVRVHRSVISAGTESAQLAKARQSLLARIRAKPALLQQGLAIWREQGLAALRSQLARKFEGYSELGYSCAGTVVHAGDDPRHPPAGTRVACAGAGLAHHAEFVSLPLNLTAPVPDGVTDESAAYSTLGAIALQGVRQAQVQLGEYVVVIGLGLVGLLAGQLLRAAGCRVAGIDPSAKARARGRASGCDVVAGPEDAAEAILTLSSGLGADAVIICAATPSSAPVALAGQLARSRGRVVMVGATGMNLPREAYFLKELSFTLSRSYGPGRYDRHYEEGGVDYPLDYVRFTEQRNLRAFLEMAQQGRVEPSRLTTHRYPLDQAASAYALLNDATADRAGILLEYPAPESALPAAFTIACAPAAPPARRDIGVGFVGAGAYAQSMLLPLLKARADVSLRAVMTRQGSHGVDAARRFGFASASTRVEELLENPDIHAVFITTRHDTHADLTCRALTAGKHVWVEKPLALSLAELQAVTRALREHPAARLVVGFNRPYSPAAAWLGARLGALAPRQMLYRVNAGPVPVQSWVHDPKLGGGRLIGEGCHFFDFLRHMAGAAGAETPEPQAGTGVLPITADVVYTEALPPARADLPPDANFSATVRFARGSVGQLLYTSQGSARMRKEYFECFTGGCSGVLDDFRGAEFFREDRRERLSRRGQDKGQCALLDAFLQSVQNGTPSPMRREDVLESSLLTLAAKQSLEQRAPVMLAPLRTMLP